MLDRDNQNQLALSWYRLIPILSIQVYRSVKAAEVLRFSSPWLIMSYTKTSARFYSSHTGNGGVSEEGNQELL